jgi:hypothetical protein
VLLTTHSRDGRFLWTTFRQLVSMKTKSVEMVDASEAHGALGRNLPAASGTEGSHRLLCGARPLSPTVPGSFIASTSLAFSASRPGLSCGAARDSMVGVSLSKNVAAEGWIAQVAERLPVTDVSGRAPSPSVEARAFRRGHQRRPPRSVIDSVYAEGAICDADSHHPLRSWGLRQNRRPPRRKRGRPM